MTLARLLVLLSLDASGFNRGMYLALGQVQALERSFVNFGNLSSGLSSLGASLTRYVTVPLLGIVAAATVAGVSLNKEMGQIQTLLSGSFAETTVRAEELRSTVQDMAIQFAIGTHQMTEGMYEMISAFGDGQQALEGLRVAALSAKAGNADLGDTVQMLISVYKGLQNDTKSFQEISDLAFKTAAIGQTTFQGLASSIGEVVPLADAAGIKLEEVFAVLATAPGVTGTTSEVVTQLRSAIRSLIDPVEKLKKAYKEMGVASGEELIAKSGGLVQALQAITQYSKDANVPLGDLIGRLEGMLLTTLLTGSQLDDYNQKLKILQEVSGATDEAFRKVTEGIGAQAFTWEQLGVKTQVLFEKLQEGLAPALGAVLDKLGPVADKAIVLADAFTKLDPATQQQIVNWGLFAIALGPALRILGGIVSAITGLWGVVSVVGPMIGSGLLAISWPLALVMAAVTILAIVWNQNWFNIQERTAAARDAIIPHIDAIKASYASWISTVQQTDFSSWDGFWASMANNRAAFVNMMYEIGQATQDAIAAFAGFQNATAFGMTAIRQMQDAFTGAKATVAGWAAAFVERLYATSAASAQFGAMLGTSVRNASTAAGQAVLNLAIQIASGLKSAFAQAIAAAGAAVVGIRSAFSLNWGAIGSSITSGIAAGIRSGIGAIISAAQSVASAAYSAAMSALKANSPSRLMMGPGLYAAQGLAIGMLNGISYVEDAAAQMIAPLTNIANGGGPRLALAGSSGMMIQIENNFNGPVSDATIAQVEDANRRSITTALRGEGYL